MFDLWGEKIKLGVEDGNFPTLLLLEICLFGFVNNGKCSFSISIPSSVIPFQQSKQNLMTYFSWWKIMKFERSKLL